MVQISAKRT